MPNFRQVQSQPRLEGALSLKLIEPLKGDSRKTRFVKATFSGTSETKSEEKKGILFERDHQIFNKARKS